MDESKRSSVTFVLKDVRGTMIEDRVRLVFRNLAAQSRGLEASVDFRGKSVTISDIPAAPTGLYQLLIAPDTYRAKSIFLAVPPGHPTRVEETLFVEPAKVDPVFPDAASIQDSLRELLKTSEIDYVALDNLQKAGLLNLFAKMSKEKVEDKRAVITFVHKILEVRPDRICGEVSEELLTSLRLSSMSFQPASALLHSFPEGWIRIEPNGSFKTLDPIGCLQLTFAKNAEGRYMVEADLDDRQGVEHAFSVLRQKLTPETHPYDVQQILVFFQGIDPGYGFSKQSVTTQSVTTLS